MTTIRIRLFACLCALCLLLSLSGCTAAGIATEDNVIVDTTGMTDLQKAICITAESYYLRGARVQYDQTGFGKGTSASIPRRSTAIRKPEDYTAQYFGYHDCSSFVFDIYWSALGMDFSEGSSKRNTKWFMSNPHIVLKEEPELNFFDLTEEEIAQKKTEFVEALQPGDIIVYRKRGNGSGHALLYVGNDTLFHSQGADYKGIFESYESNGTYTKDSLEKLLLTPGATRYLFNKYSYAILRPLAAFEGEIPADTVSRIGNMRGIMAEKLSSHTFGQTVSLGGEITFTFHVENRSKADKTLTVTDTVPAYTTYVTGADTVEGTTLSWNITVPAEGSKDVFYTVKVTEDAAALGKTVESQSYIEDVAVNCPAITIARTLTETEQQTLLTALEANKKNGGGLALADTVYREAFGFTRLSGITSRQLSDTIYTHWNAENNLDCALDPQSTFADIVVPRLYGGMYVVEQDTATSYLRTRLLKADQLVIGDLIVADGESYLFTGDALVNLDNGESVDTEILQQFVGYYTFAVIRPSMAF